MFFILMKYKINITDLEESFLLHNPSILEPSSVLGHCLQRNKIKLALKNSKKILTVLLMSPETHYKVACKVPELRGFPHLSDPGDERGHTGKDCGLLGGVTATSIHKTSNTLDVPFSISAFTVERTSGVTLEEDKSYYLQQFWKVTHICFTQIAGKIGLIEHQDTPWHQLFDMLWGCCSHGTLTCSLLLHKPWLSSLSCPTSRSEHRCCAPPQEVEPAVAWLPGAHQLREDDIHSQILVIINK